MVCSVTTIHSNGPGDGSHGHTNAAQRMRSDRGAATSASIWRDRRRALLQGRQHRKAASQIPKGEFSILCLIRRKFIVRLPTPISNLMLSGHTHVAALSSRDSDQTGGSVATTNGAGAWQPSQHERLHLCGCRIKRRSRGRLNCPAGNQPCIAFARADDEQWHPQLQDMRGVATREPVSARFDCHSIQQSAFGQSACLARAPSIDS